MVFKLYNDSPSLMKPGVYQSGSITEDQIGLNTIDLEKYSLGNWNSIVKNDRKFWSPLSDPTVTSLVDQGRPVQLYFAPSAVIQSYNDYSGIDGALDVSDIEIVTLEELRDDWPDDRYAGLPGRFLQPSGRTDPTYTTSIREDWPMQYDDGYGHIVERTASDIANNRLIIKLDDDLQFKRSVMLGSNAIWGPEDVVDAEDNDEGYDVTFQLYFDFS